MGLGLQNVESISYTASLCFKFTNPQTPSHVISVLNLYFHDTSRVRNVKLTVSSFHPGYRWTTSIVQIDCFSQCIQGSPISQPINDGDNKFENILLRRNWRDLSLDPSVGTDSLFGGCTQGVNWANAAVGQRQRLEGPFTLSVSDAVIVSGHP